MKSIALLDGDIVAFRCAATCENEHQAVAEHRTNELIHRILHDVNAVNYKVFLTGKNNFRKEIYPEYKANRIGRPKPKHLTACRNYLVDNWKALVIDGREADDELGIEQTAHGLESVICSIDKDLLQIPGYHYNFVKGIESFISPYDGLRSFYSQLITGDAGDNVPAFDGKFRTSVPKFVQRLLDPFQELTDEFEMYDYCSTLYSDLDIMHRNAQCLYILKKENEFWQPPSEESGADQQTACTSPD